MGFLKQGGRLKSQDLDGSLTLFNTGDLSFWVGVMGVEWSGEADVH